MSVDQILRILDTQKKWWKEDYVTGAYTEFPGP